MSLDTFARLGTVLPKLKTPIQILGLLIIVGGVIAYRTVPPEYVRGVFAAGSMGIFFLIFGQVFSILPTIPRDQRGSLVIILVSIFAVFTLAAIALTAYFVITAEPHVLFLRKLGQFVRPASEANVTDVVKYVHESGNCDFSVPDIQEAGLIIHTIENSSVASKDEVEFARDWEERRNELKDTVCRLAMSYGDKTLVASNFSRQQDSKVASEIRRGNKMPIYGGKDARDMLVALMDRAETDPNRVNEYIVEAISNLVSVGYTNLYSQLAYIPQRYSDVVDADFLKFAKQIPHSYFDIVKGAIFPDAKGAFVEFECDSPASGQREHSYSRFIVPASDVDQPEILDRMSNGPWPVGHAQELFSERWWLRYAVWQMLGREHGKYLAGLAIRINEYGDCGPP